MAGGRQGSQCPVRRPDWLHIYWVGGPRAPQPLIIMQRFCFANDRDFEEAKTELFPLPGRSTGASRGPKQVWESDGGHHICHKVEALHTYSVQLPHRRGQKVPNTSCQVDIFKAVFKKARSFDGSNPCILGVSVHASTGSIVNNRSP